MRLKTDCNITEVQYSTTDHMTKNAEKVKRINRAGRQGSLIYFSNKKKGLAQSGKKSIFEVFPAQIDERNRSYFGNEEVEYRERYN